MGCPPLHNEFYPLLSGLEINIGYLKSGICHYRNSSFEVSKIPLNFLSTVCANAILLFLFELEVTFKCCLLPDIWQVSSGDGMPVLCFNG